MPRARFGRFGRRPDVAPYAHGRRAHVGIASERTRRPLGRVEMRIIRPSLRQRPLEGRVPEDTSAVTQAERHLCESPTRHGNRKHRRHGRLGEVARNHGSTAGIERDGGPAVRSRRRRARRRYASTISCATSAFQPARSSVR